MSATKKTIQAGRQIGGVFLSPDWIEKPQLAQPYLKRIKGLGYSSVIIFVRHQKRTVRDQRVHDAVKAVARAGRRLGLRMLLDTDPTWWGMTVVEAHPETALWTIRSVATTVQTGRFEMRVFFPSLPEQIAFREISAVFRPDGKGGYRALPTVGVKSQNMHFAAPRRGFILKGELPGRYSGPAVFYVALQTYGLVDVAHPLYLKAQKQLINAYADIPLDGFAWDEPGKGAGDLTCFKAGAGFLPFFKKVNGYELRPNLIYLDHCDGTPQAAQVRCDFYGTLVEVNYIAQKRHNDHARRRFKRDLMFGTHNTWSGFPMDLPTGCIDYFKLGKNLTAAWTDGGWDPYEVKYIVHNYMLAEGLKKELGCRDAFYNDWGATLPGVGNMRFSNRLKMLFHVNWFNHCVSDYSEGLINFTQEPLRSAAEKDTKNLDRFDGLVGDRFAPHTDIAYLYSWETLAAAPKWMTRMFYTGIANTNFLLADQALYAAIMSGESILKAKIGDRCFTVNGFTYRVLLMPFVNVIRGAVYRRAMRINEAGVPVIVVGPPPEFIAEDGRRIAEDFARRVGFKPFSLNQYIGALAGQTALPPLDEWEPSWVDATYPVETTTAQTVYDQEDRLLCVKSANGSLYYMPAPDPREELTTLLSAMVTPLVETFAEDTYYRFFPHRQDPEQMVVVAVAKAHAASFALAPDKYGRALRPPIRPHQIKALFRFKGGDLIVKGGAWCAIRMKRNQAMETIGDCPSIRWNGRRITQSRPA